MWGQALPSISPIWIRGWKITVCQWAPFGKVYVGCRGREVVCLLWNWEEQLEKSGPQSLLCPLRPRLVQLFLGRNKNEYKGGGVSFSGVQGKAGALHHEGFPPRVPNRPRITQYHSVRSARCPRITEFHYVGFPSVVRPPCNRYPVPCPVQYWVLHRS